MSPTDALQDLQERLGHSFTDPHLLEEAMTHPSYANDAGLGYDFERLEFLGDAILGFLTSAWLYRRYRARDEGALSKLKAWLVSAPSLAAAARRLGLGGALRLSVGEERSGGRNRETILADALEAVFAALYLDGGQDAVQPHVDDLLEWGVRRYEQEMALRDAKTRLQEITQARGWDLPEYRDVRVEGPDHARVYTVECWVRGERLSQGSGGSRKAAQQAAAAQALRTSDLLAGEDD
jgi:ribonuclease-3